MLFARSSVQFIKRFRLRILAIAITAVSAIIAISKSIAFPLYALMIMGPINFAGPTNYYTQVSAAWTHTFSASGGTGVFVYTLPVAPGGATVNASTGQVDYTPAAAGTYAFTIRATDSAGAVKDFNFVLEAYAAGVCLWTGGTSSSWPTAANWQFCGGLAPTSTSDVAIYAQASNMPILMANTTVNSFGLGPGGGTVTVNAGITLSITAVTNSIRSSVAFQGGVTTCTTCNVTGTSIVVTDSSTLTLLKGIKFVSSNVDSFKIGDGVTSGRLVTSGGSVVNEWPLIGNYSSCAPGTSIQVQGTAADRSSVNIDGLKNGCTGGNMFKFIDWYRIEKFDNVSFDPYSAPVSGNAYINMGVCTNSIVLDTSWDGITFVDPLSSGYNVRADGAGCSGLPAITVSNTAGQTGGAAYGPLFELDPNNKINWANGGSSICTWSGTVSSVWTNSANWSGCTNGRGDIPGAVDDVIIPSSAINQPALGVNTSIAGFALSGGGGGVLTINAGYGLTLTRATSTIRSDVQFQGSTPGCTNCGVYFGGNMEVTDGAKVTLLKGIRVYGVKVKVGNGVSSGSFATIGGANSAEWPILGSPACGGGTSLDVQGVSGQNSSVSIDGLTMSCYPSTMTAIDFKDWYEVQKFDNISFLRWYSFLSASQAYVKLSSCANAVMTDQGWDGLKFENPPVSSGYNISALNANCNGLPSITVSNPAGTSGGMGYGPIFEGDPFSKINWANSSSSVCTWNGSVDSSWLNPSNWSGCANGRANYPDQLDSVVIPSAPPNQPTVSTSTAVYSFALSGVGGGLITVNNGSALYVAKPSASIQSDIKLQGSPSTCTNCNFISLADFEVTDGSTLTLLKGARVSSQSKLKIGTGTSHGNIVSSAGALSTEWPMIGSFACGGGTTLDVNGTSTNRSTVRFSGIKFGCHGGTMVNFLDWYDIQQFDNASFSTNNSMGGGNASIKFTTCTNAHISSNTWSNHTFSVNLGGGTNVSAAGTNCSSLPIINMYQALGPQAGATYENDPNNKINWTNVFLTDTTSFDASVGTAFTHTFVASGGTTPYTYSLTVNPDGASIDPSTGAFTYTPTSVGAKTFTVRVTEAGPATYMDFTFTMNVYAAGVCVWNGSVSSSWTAAGNWSFCGGLAPTATSDVAIPATAPVMPILLANTTVNSFGLGPGGGIVTVNATLSLSITAATSSIRSSVKFQGGTTTCTNCGVYGAGNLYVTDGATLTLQKGIKYIPGGWGGAYFGDGVTAGNMTTIAGTNSAEWPVISNCLGPASYISFNGTAAKKSVAKIDGLKVGLTCGVTANLINFADYYDIQQFDNITFDNSGSSGITPLKLSSCTNASVSDVNWSNYTFNIAPGGGTYNINAGGTNCSTLPVITVNNSTVANGGGGYGSAFENDPNNKINWANSNSMACVWTGAVDTSWTNPSNWNSCGNSRGNYPDQLDTVVIPVVANQPVISANTTIYGFAQSGSGGGTVTVNAGYSLGLVKATSTIRSDIKFQGSTSTCTTCLVYGVGNIAITDGATATLLKGIRLATGGGQTDYLDIGDGATAGFLATGPAGPISEWPTVGGNYWPTHIRVNGVSTQRSGVNLDGLVVSHGNIVGTSLFEFIDWYEVQKFDNLKFGLFGAAWWNLVKLTSCTNALISDTTWSEMIFNSALYTGGYNINAAGTNCSSLPAITVSNATGTSGGLGYGSFYENDPNNKINWSNDTSYACTWTGAANSTWTNPSNWSGCTNGRANYPDQIDTPIIPVTGTQPTLAAFTALRGIGTGTGGGTVTINGGVTLFLTAPASTIRSDVQFQGSTTTCTNCSILGGSALYVTDAATLTLLKGIRINPSLKLGDGVTSGNLTTNAGTIPSEWPSLSNCTSPAPAILFNGTSTTKSIAKINGFNVGVTCGTGVNLIDFSNYYDIQQMDNLSFNNSGSFWAVNKSPIILSDCTNATITNTSWTNLSFSNAPSAGAYNIQAAGTNCSTLPTIGISGATGAGACGVVGSGACTYENDPNSKIDWNP